MTAHQLIERLKMYPPETPVHIKRVAGEGYSTEETKHALEHEDVSYEALNYLGRKVVVFY